VGILPLLLLLPRFLLQVIMMLFLSLPHPKANFVPLPKNGKNSNDTYYYYYYYYYCCCCCS